jgi:two-component system LytT family response regulator
VDYLVKPLEARRFDRALERARRACRAAANDDLRVALEAEAAAASPRRFALRVGNRVRFFDPSTIDYFKAEGDYVAVHAAKETLLVRERLKDLQQALTPHGFVRIHRSTLVNAGRVREIRPAGTGEYEVLLEDGTRFASSASCRDDVERLMRSAREAQDPAADARRPRVRGGPR